MNWLYNEPIKTPNSKMQYKNLMQAYVLARMYNAYSLQNLIVDRFRDHYSHFNMSEYSRPVDMRQKIGRKATIRTFHFWK